jgi:hypothetical protein
VAVLAVDPCAQAADAASTANMPAINNTFAICARSLLCQCNAAGAPVVPPKKRGAGAPVLHSLPARTDALGAPRRTVNQCPTRTLTTVRPLRPGIARYSLVASAEVPLLLQRTVSG